MLVLVRGPNDNERWPLGAADYATDTAVAGGDWLRTAVGTGTGRPLRYTRVMVGDVGDVGLTLRESTVAADNGGGGDDDAALLTEAGAPRSGNGAASRPAALVLRRVGLDERGGGGDVRTGASAAIMGSAGPGIAGRQPGGKADE